MARLIRHVHNNKLIHLISLLFLLLLTSQTAAQTVTPLRAVLSSDNPEAVFTVSNPTDRLLEVKLDWLDLTAREDGTYEPASAEHRASSSAAPYLIVTPAGFQLSPGMSRIVRVVRRDDAKSGTQPERRSHLLIETQPAGKNLKTVSAKLPINMALGMSVPVILRDGAADIRAEIDQVKLVRMTDGGLALSVTINANGAHSLYGAIRAETAGRQKQTIARRENIAVYPETGTRRILMELGRASLPEGQLEIIYEGRGAYAGDVLARRIFIVGPPSGDGQT